MAGTSVKKWRVDYAKSGRSSCKICQRTIQLDKFRLGKVIKASRFDGYFVKWNHADCIMRKANWIKSISDIDGLELLRWEDQQKIRKYVQGGGFSGKSNGSSLEIAIEVSPTSRATCRHCLQKIMQGEVRISTKPDPRTLVVAWHHASCFLDFSPSINVDDLYGWGSLPDSDQATVRAMVKKIPSSAKNATKDGVQEDKELLLESTSISKGKRKRSGNDGQKAKVVKTKREVSASSKMVSSKNIENSGKEEAGPSVHESEIQVQTKESWAIKDNLKKYVTKGELCEMLEANGQDSTGPEEELRHCSADGMLFGVLGSCTVCSGSLRFSGGNYICHGYLSAWSKCSYSTQDPVRLKGKWKVPEGTSNKYLIQWFKSQKADKPVRVIAYGQSQPSDGESLKDLKVAVVGFTEKSGNAWKARIESVGGLVHPRMLRDIQCLVFGGKLDHQYPEIRKARRMKIPVVREAYLVDCFKMEKKLQCDPYRVETMGRISGKGSARHQVSTVNLKVKGKSAVHEYSGLQDSGHILEDRKSIYNTTLNMSDLSTGIIQEDQSSVCYLFRKWGRVGNEQIGGSKLDEMSKSDAIFAFKRLFHQKTGNPWDAWESKENFQKQPGRYYPLDIDYGVNKQVGRKMSWADADSQLSPPLRELMRMLFNRKTYVAVMVEFKINTSEMPLGKLSKINIQKGFEALTDVQNLLNSKNHDPSVRETLLVDASNRFFTLIPSTHPHVIKDADDLRSKVKMLEALQDIEIASRVIGFDAESEESLDEKYKKLHCHINPLPQDSEDYQLIEKYLRNTHAPTHTDWSLELEEVFSIEREGESDNFVSCGKNLKNRMLLWHGSRLTNFVGTLIQGFRIAPPEVPTSGFMFGKGVYFADMVSKSAQYCCTTKRSPVGLMLLSEVALGEVYECKSGEFMKKPPEGKHSTKGVGSKKPDESEYMKWKDDVVVPCGRPVSSKIGASSLLYNEYIVYDTAQVNMRFLLKVRFHHKW